jgi:membrane protease YdiL (CAAX protease family)
MIRTIFSGLILPLLSLPTISYIYSLQMDYYSKLYYSAILISITEIISLLLVKNINNDKKINLNINKGLIYGVILSILMIIFPFPQKFIVPQYVLIPILISAIVSSICEELIYRGYLIDNITSVFVQGILWSLLHIFNGITFYLWTLLIGIILGFISKNYGVLPTILAHLISNLIRLIISIL